MDNKYIIRDLQEDDYDLGYMDCVNELTVPVKLMKTEFVERFRLIKNKKDYFNLVVIDKEANKVVGCGTLFIEHKFIRGCVKKGHIEDIVVVEKYRGKGIGKLIVTHLVEIGRKEGVYKISMVCDQSNCKFYKKCGFTEKEIEMVIYT